MIVVGLGNPGRRYAGTRHSVGFMIVDRLVKDLGGRPWRSEFGVRWSKVGPHWIIKPWEFMNHSGPALKRFMAAKRLGFTTANMAESLIVIHDDVDFPIGTERLVHQRTSAGHRGVQSIIDTFGTKEFDRLRIGIGDNRAAGLPAEAYVLQLFSRAERPVIEQSLHQAVELVKSRLGVT
ncbi:MAG: aminoacyl-tRNA hydrolase [Candidatus Kerfeldbacteria bacterium]|nr:aminoacyl-tRNA hydrolase [Candidatus Kerfeldbacteria bacterium]